MKKLLHTLLFAAVPFATSAQITVSTSQYTTGQLVNTVLTTNVVTTATGITSLTGSDFSSVNGIGYFENNNSGFAFANGIILSSGDALNAPGPNTGISNSGSEDWLGDSDINSFMLNYTGSQYSSKNASVLEFDFTPFKNEISLDYLFASNEYGTYQCNFGDGVIMLLKDVTSGTAYTNIAVVPNTTVPIATTTIRDNANNSACTSVNAQYFGTYYAASPLTAPINYNGATIPLTAQATVVAGHTYHLKIVIADRQDSAYDSAVLLRAEALI